MGVRRAGKAVIAVIVLAGVCALPVLGGNGEIHGEVHGVIDQFFLASILSDEQLFEDTLSPEGIIEVVSRGEVFELDHEQMKREFFYSSQEYVFENREIAMLNGDAAVTGTIIEGNPRYPAYEVYTSRCTFSLTCRGQQWYISRLEIIDQDFAEREFTAYPGTLQMYENAYFTFSYPALWDLAADETEPTRFMPEIMWVRLSAPRRGAFSFAANIRVFEREFETFAQEAANDQEGQEMFQRDYKVLGEASFEDPGGNPVRVVHAAYQDFSRRNRRSLRFYAANDEVFVVGTSEYGEDENEKVQIQRITSFLQTWQMR